MIFQLEVPSEAIPLGVTHVEIGSLIFLLPLSGNSVWMAHWLLLVAVS